MQSLESSVINKSGNESAGGAARLPKARSTKPSNLLGLGKKQATEKFAPTGTDNLVRDIMSSEFDK